MITKINTSININLVFANRDELAEFYSMLNSACVAIIEKARNIDDEYFYKRAEQLEHFTAKFNPVTVLGKIC